MSDDRAKDEDQQNELTFVVTTNPSDRKSAANKKRVRSVAALKSWPERRKRTFAHYDHSASTGGFVLEDAGAGSGSSRRHATTKRKESSTVASATSTLASQSQANEEPLFEMCTRAVNDVCNCIHCRTEKRYRYGPSQGATTKHVAFPHTVAPRGRKRTADGQLKGRVPKGDLAMLTPPSSPSPSPLAIVKNEGRAEPFNCYPVPYRPWFDRILHHSMFNPLLVYEHQHSGN